MAATQAPIEPNDICKFWRPNDIERLVVVLEEMPATPGTNWKEFKVICVKTGLDFVTPGCWLTQCEVLDPGNIHKPGGICRSP